MKRFYRFIFQVFLWLVVWGIIWVVADADARFIMMNGPTFIFQILLLLGLVYYAVPKLLFERKYAYFLIITISALLVTAYLATQTMPPPPFGRPPGPLQNGPPRGLLTRYPIHLLILSVSSIMAILLETFIFAQKKEKSMAFAKAELIESELKFLKMQINPHFLFNALNNIYALSVTNSNKTQESISTLSEMLRYVIYDCEQPKVPLMKELDYIANYIELFKLKSSKSFDISFTTEVADECVMVAPMLFVPYIENAFKHSGIEKGNDHFVHVSLVQREQNIEFSVENSIPTTASSTDSQGGIGLPNVQKRLEILYPDKHDLKISDAKVFKVNLKLELQ